MAQTDDQLNSLAEHLHAARGHILQDWREVVAQDPELTTASRISRSQFIDHIPQVLDAFEHRLRANDPGERHQARVEQRQNAAEHGLHRWQQGYDLRETMRQWGHLHLCVLLELERFGRQQLSLDELAGESGAAPAPTLTSRSEPQSAPPSSGEGIGLSIVKRLCELLDASLELQTSAGRGTTFRVTLPRHY